MQRNSCISKYNLIKGRKDWNVVFSMVSFSNYTVGSTMEFLEFSIENPEIDDA